MIRPVLALGLLAALAACGVDGPPVPPSQVVEEDDAPPIPGVTVSGSVGIGVSRRS